MARRVFFSFHYEEDNWRAAEIRNMGVIEGNKPVSDNDWEEITRGGDEAIKKWINDQMAGTSCTVVLIGTHTAGRKWINYEIKKSWNDEKGLLGIYIHNLEDRNGKQSIKGKNPFDNFTIRGNNIRLSSIVKAYDPPYSNSKNVYSYIKDHLADWVEEAIKMRSQY